MMIFKKPANFRALMVTGFLIAIILCAKSIALGSFGQIGSDNDDAMRLVQIRDLIAGQSWFDVTQYRMGPEGGTLMHWSRIADIPVLLITLFFDIFLPTAWAEKIAFTTWPLICAVLTAYGVLTGVRHLGAGKTAILSCLLLFMALIGYFRFLPGSIDHHNFQLALVAIAIGHALDPDLKTRSAVISAIAMAMSLAIGPEVYFLIAVLCGYFTVRWLFEPETVKTGTVAMGSAFAGALAVIFLGTTAPANYGVIHCDSFSLITALACITGGAGLATAAIMTTDKSLPIRIVVLAILALICAALFLIQAPQCLANPLSELPEDLRSSWLDNIQEAQPLFKNKSEIFAMVPFALGAPLVALVVCFLNLRRRENVYRYGFIAALLLLSMGLTIYQLRFLIFGHVVSLFALTPWVGHLYTEGKKREGPNVRYTAALAASIPIFWAMPGTLLDPEDKSIKEAKERTLYCYSETVMDAINDLEPGRFAASSNAAASLLMHTDHSVLSGNYHRNVVGIMENAAIFDDPPEAAKAKLIAHKIDYIHICRTSSFYQIPATTKPDSLANTLVNRNPPDFIEPIGEDLEEEGAVTLYRVLR